MSEIIQGTVKRIKNSDLPAPDRFDNTTRLSALIETAEGEVWVGLGTKKRPGLDIQKGKDWIHVGEGSTVLIIAERNGEYLNSKTSDVKVLSLVAPSGTSASPPQAKTPLATPAPAPTAASPIRPAADNAKTDWAAKDAGAIASASLDKALRSFALSGIKHPTDDALLTEARRFNRLVDVIKNEILNPVSVSAPSQISPSTASPVKPASTNGLVKAPAKPKAVEPPTQDELDDEIPF